MSTALSEKTQISDDKAKHTQNLKRMRVSHAWLTLKLTLETPAAGVPTRHDETGGSLPAPLERRLASSSE